MGPSDGMHLEKHTKHLATSVIAIGTVFTDEVLHPQERIERTLVFSVPSEKYTQIEVRVFLPTMQQEKGIDLEWVLVDGSTSRISLQH